MPAVETADAFCEPGAAGVRRLSITGEWVTWMMKIVDPYVIIRSPSAYADAGCSAAASVVPAITVSARAAVSPPRFDTPPAHRWTSRGSATVAIDKGQPISQSGQHGYRVCTTASSGRWQIGQ